MHVGRRTTRFRHARLTLPQGVREREKTVAVRSGDLARERPGIRTPRGPPADLFEELRTCAEMQQTTRKDRGLQPDLGDAFGCRGLPVGIGPRRPTGQGGRAEVVPVNVALGQRMLRVVARGRVAEFDDHPAQPARMQRADLVDQERAFRQEHRGHPQVERPARLPRRRHLGVEHRGRELVHHPAGADEDEVVLVPVRRVVSELFLHLVGPLERRRPNRSPPHSNKASATRKISAFVPAMRQPA